MTKPTMMAPSIAEVRKRLSDKLEKILEAHDKKWLEDDHYREISNQAMLATAKAMYDGKRMTPTPLTVEHKKKVSEAIKRGWEKRRAKMNINKK